MNDSELFFEDLIRRALSQWPSAVRSDDDILDLDRTTFPSIGMVTEDLLRKQSDPVKAWFYSLLHAQIAHSVRFALHAVTIVFLKDIFVEPIRIRFEDALLDTDFSDCNNADASNVHAYRDRYFLANGGEFANTPPNRLLSSIPGYD